jgi:phospholipid-binding lipoprotein MlaA
MSAAGPSQGTRPLAARACTWLMTGALLLAGCTSAPTRTASAVDPLEPMNRTLFQVHDTLDRVVLKPVVDVYTAVLPRPARTAVSNFFNNLDDLWSAANGMLQAKPQKAGDDLGRVLTNTMFGLGGLIDVASSAGIERGNEDFGQTLAVWGVGAGPYLFIPLLGPSTFRDATGTVARAYASPIGYAEDVPLRNSLYGLYAVDARYQAGDALSVVETAALDRYTFIRNAYLQRRRYLIYDGKVPADKEEQ